MLISLTSPSPSSNANDTTNISPSIVGGKAASLSKLYTIPQLQNQNVVVVPKSYALSTAFFQPWVDEIVSWITNNESGGDDDGEFAVLMKIIDGKNTTATIDNNNDDDDDRLLKETCQKLKSKCMTLPLTQSQQQTLHTLQNIISTSFNYKLAAVRSSSVEEDGMHSSYAGMYETLLGVTECKLEEAVRKCFGSKFDERVLLYDGIRSSSGGNNNSSDNTGLKGGFAVVIMEMVNSITAGVAFSANPLNSDRDEIVIDSSYGLEKQNASSLSMEQVNELVKMVEIVENVYDTPMDIEWAYYYAGGEQQQKGQQQLVLLQARPITTLFTLDANMMTLPHERRILYYDFNIASEATTTSPFTRMDMDISNEWMNMGMGLAKHDGEEVDMLLDDPNLPLFKSSTRQYINLSFLFKFFTPTQFAKDAYTLDPHLASLFTSKDCDRKRYRSKKRWPKQCSVRNAFWLLRKLPLWKWYRVGKRFQKDPEKAKLAYIQMVESDMAKVKALQQRGLQRDEDGRGLTKFSKEICQCCLSSFDEELGAIYFVVLGTFNTLDKKRRDSSASEQVRAEYDALCSGYDGDELMKINIDMYRLANKLDASIWKEYGHDELHELAVRIQQNLDGTVSDLPSEFLTEWSSFMDQHGYDGVDQLFISSPRYQDKPELLLTRLRQNVGVGLFKASRIRKRNEILDHVMWIRNAPKLHFARMIGVLREAVLQIENELIEANRLQNKGDIFHLDLEEVDQALADETIDLMQIITPRKAVYERVLEATRVVKSLQQR
ncbi:hypothetical protein ACHAWC_004916 [Mediolabrus comicus]